MPDFDRPAVPSLRLFSEVPDADAADQQHPVVDDSAAAMRRLRVPFDADPADAPDEMRTVPLDEDDYR
jgi:hypothetical protein